MTIENTVGTFEAPKQILDTSIEQASQAVHKALEKLEPAVLAPKDFQLHNLEKFLDYRLRMRGLMKTPLVADFASYVGAHSQTNSTCIYIDPQEMSARAVLDQGTVDKPGHCEHSAQLTLKRTAPYSALRAMNGEKVTQLSMVEFLEDWGDAAKVKLTGEDGTTDVPLAKALAAFRTITIEHARKDEHDEQQLSRSRSLMEAAAAKSKETLPTRLTFTCKPYAELQERTFQARISVLTAYEKPVIVLRIINLEEHEEAMANELAVMVREQTENTATVFVGNFITAN